MIVKLEPGRKIYKTKDGVLIQQYNIIYTTTKVFYNVMLMLARKKIFIVFFNKRKDIIEVITSFISPTSPCTVVQILKKRKLRRHPDLKSKMATCPR